MCEMDPATLLLERLQEAADEDEAKAILRDLAETAEREPRFTAQLLDFLISFEHPRILIEALSSLVGDSPQEVVAFR